MDNPFTINAIKTPATGCLVFLHGSGDSGQGIGETFKALKGKSAQFPHIKIVFPTAPLLPFTAYGGMMVNTWYDISNFSEDAVENTDHIKKSASQIIKLVENEVSSGIPINRIAVAGFSRGGAMSWYIGYSYLTELAGVGVLSSWLPRTSHIYEKLIETKGAKNYPPLFQGHGSHDFVVQPTLAVKTSDFFKSVGIQTDFKMYQSVGHEVRAQGLDDLYTFVHRVIPDNC